MAYMDTTPHTEDTMEYAKGQIVRIDLVGTEYELEIVEDFGQQVTVKEQGAPDILATIAMKSCIKEVLA